MSSGARRHQFERLVVAAEKEVEKVIRALPPAVRAAARRVPVLYEPVPGPDLLQDGVAPDTMGLFVGEPYPEAYAGAHNLPAQIILFLENIWEFANHDPALFRREVRTTILHELGHYLGLDEDELAERELD
ncbi:MAG: metallopeptidase family protein [Kiritimatiellae bacterium]|nr:metallopeptidase family protein [Kiritimatiellia bacterium]MDW8458723.1 metallopeptidase family protein [Verrucomicrobiota bacterium]